MKRQTLTPLHRSLDLVHISNVLRRANKKNGDGNVSPQSLEQSVADLRMQVSELDVAVREKCN